MIELVDMPKTRCRICPMVIVREYFPDESCPDYFTFGMCLEDRCTEWSEERGRCALASS